MPLFMDPGGSILRSQEFCHNPYPEVCLSNSSYWNIVLPSTFNTTIIISLWDKLCFCHFIIALLLKMILHFILKQLKVTLIYWIMCRNQNLLLSMEPKSFKLVWRYCQILSGFLVNGHLPRVSRLSRFSANDKDDKIWYLGLCTHFLAFTLQIRKTPEKLN